MVGLERTGPLERTSGNIGARLTARYGAGVGKKHHTVGGQYTDEQLELFDAYYRRFKLGSKPTWHIRAMGALDDAELAADMPAVMTALFDHVETALESLPK